MKSSDKIIFERPACDNSGSTQITIPPELVKHLEIEKGDTVALQVEHSDEHGEYASFWNQTKQQGEKQ